MSSKKVSPFRRFLLARLRPFFRPTFLLSTFFLGLLTVSVWQYWQNPNSLNPTVSGKNNSGTKPQIDRTAIPPQEDPEQAAIGADLDNSQLLKEELAKSSKIPATIPVVNGKGKNKIKEQQQPETAYSRYLKNQQEGKDSDTTTTNITSPNSSIPSARDILNGNTNNSNGVNGDTNNANTNNTSQFGSNYTSGYNNTNTGSTTTQFGTTNSTVRTVTPNSYNRSNTTTGTTQIGNVNNPTQVNNGSSYNGVQTNNPYTNNPYSSQTSTVNTNPTGVNNNYNTSTTTSGNRVPTINNVPTNNNGGTYNGGYYGNSGYYGSSTGSNTNLNSVPVQNNYNNNNTYNPETQNNQIRNIGGNNQSTYNNQSGFVSPEQQMRGEYQPNVYNQQTQRR